MTLDLENRIEKSFDRYTNTIAVLTEYQGAESNLNEFILLACASIDSLANALVNDSDQKNGFCTLLRTYSGHSDLLEKVSVPDLHNYLTRCEWLLPGYIPKAGRLHLFNRSEDANFAKMIWASGLAITEEEIGRLLRFLLRELQKEYRVRPGQPRAKQHYDTVTNIYEVLLERAQAQKQRKYEEAVKAIKPLLRRYKINSILYKEYRCGVIHEHGFSVDDEDFFSEREPYWALFNNEYLDYSHFRVQLPAHFLLSLLTTSLDQIKTNLIRRKKLPWTIWIDVCDLVEEGEYLDDDTGPDGLDISIQIPR